MSITKLKPSITPPGGLTPNEIPQFVSIGFDDNGSKDELNWIYEYTKDLKNNDSSNVLYTFYNSGIYKDSLSLWKKLYDHGHEIGNHTFNHPHGYEVQWKEDEVKYKNLMKTDNWINEIRENNDILAKGGIEYIPGFRTPYLKYTNNTIEAVSKEGFLYDCSISEGFQEYMTPMDYYWPYTLDNGSPGDRLLANSILNKIPVKNYPGLWEMPIYYLQIPCDELAEQYSFKKGLRKRIYRNFPFIKDNNWKMCGFDWNLWYVDESQTHLKANEFLAILKYNLDLHYIGNRTPFLFGAHIDIYNTKSKRKVFEDFIEYSLKKSDVIVTSVINVLNWIMDPKPFNTI